MSKELQEHTASPELQKFFNNLLQLKAYILEKSLETNDKTSQDTLKDIHQRLDYIIKERQI